VKMEYPAGTWQALHLPLADGFYQHS